MALQSLFKHCERKFRIKRKKYSPLEEAFPRKQQVVVKALWDYPTTIIDKQNKAIRN